MKQRLTAGIALTSFAAMLFELSLTRVFSVVLFYHYAFLVISVALLGLGAGGVFAHLRRSWLVRWSTGTVSSRLAIAGAVAMVAALEVILRTAIHLDMNALDVARLGVLYVATGIPFFLIGVLFSTVLARHAEGIARLYGADLAGAAVACLATVPLLDGIGAPNAILGAAAALSLSAAVWSPGSRTRVAGGGLAALLGLLIVANASYRLVDVTYAKGERIDTGMTEYAHWNAISRVTVTRDHTGARAIVIDADASTGIARAGADTAGRGALLASATAVCNVLRPHGAYAIIGPGGGPDVLRAVVSGSPSIAAIEINPTIAGDIMGRRYAAYSGSLYALPQVHVHVSDGRSFVRAAAGRYDVIQMTLVDTWASTAAGAFALSESNLYTVEAFTEYFEHLTPGGLLAITRWEFREPREALRVVSVAMEALHRLGVANPAAHFLVVADVALERNGVPVLVMARRTPFTRDERQTVARHVREHPPLSVLYTPSAPSANAFGRLIASNDPAGFARRYPFDVSPVSDNAPFFFFTLKAAQLMGTGSVRGIDWKNNVGVRVLVLVLLLSVAAVFAALIAPLALQRDRRPSAAAAARRLAYFVAVGLGFILIEVAFIQRFVLFLGHPTYALTVVVFLLMLAGGTGSLLSRRWLTRPAHRRWPLAAIVAMVAVWVALLPTLLPRLVGLPLPVKVLLCGVVLVPLGLAMGMPFPSGLRALGDASAPDGPRGSTSSVTTVEWAWAMNAAASVLGSVLAMVIALVAGLNATLVTGGLAYLTAFTVSGWVEREG